MVAQQSDPRCEGSSQSLTWPAETLAGLAWTRWSWCGDRSVERGDEAPQIIPVGAKVPSEAGMQPSVVRMPPSQYHALKQ